MRLSSTPAFALFICCSLYWSSAGPHESLLAQNLDNASAHKPTGSADLQEGFAEEVLATGITGATAMAIAPDGRVYLCEQTGSLRVFNDGKLLNEPFVTVKVDSSWERGLIGVALDPDFPKKPFLYLCYISPDPYPHHRISRFTAKGDVAVPNSEVIILAGDDQTKLGGNVPNGHQGGAIHFGKDGKLYIGIGEQTAGLPSQKLDTFQGKLLRINPDGSIPDDNPFFKTAEGKYRAIWAYGLRNPFAFAVQPGTGRILINDVGDARWEEINEGAAGANYGWPHAEGPSADARFKGPLYAYDHSQGKSITGGSFYNPPVIQFPKEYVGKYFFADFMDGWVRVLDPDHPTDLRPFISRLTAPVDVQVAHDGSLYILNRNAWVKDDKFKPNTGSLHRVFYVANSGKPVPLITAQPAEVIAGVGQSANFRVEVKGESPLRYQWFRNGQAMAGANSPQLTVTVSLDDEGAEFRCLISNVHGVMKSRPAALWTKPLPKLIDNLRVGLEAHDLPVLLSQTGLFRSLRDLTPGAGLLPYDVNSPLWSDGAEKHRWLVLPKDTHIGFSERGAWKFPPGTVFVKHFELPAEDGKPNRRLETRLLVVDRRGAGYGVTYKWRNDGSDAELLTEGLTEQIELGGRKRTWSYPSRNDCLVCHNNSAGFVLGVNTRQLNHLQADSAGKVATNLLQAWNRLGLFQPVIGNEDIPKFDRLVAITDTTASLEHRVLSYLDSNCAQCHRPGVTRGEFDARFGIPLDQKRLINGTLSTSDLGVIGAKQVVPGNPERSMLYLRMKRRQDVFNMPPLGTYEVDPAAITAIHDWIEGLRIIQTKPKETPAPRSVAPKQFGEVEDLLQKHVDRKHVAGAVALVLHRGKPVFSAAIGSADIGANRPMAADTLFRIASMTKPITSVAVMMLVEEGKVKVDDPVSKYLPEFKNLRVLDPKGSGTVAAVREITIHNLLTHTSGLSYGFLAGDRLGPAYREAKVSDGLALADSALAENIRRLAGVPLKYQPGEAWEYGLSTDVLGRLIEVVSKKPLDEFFQDRIFQPLGMSDTHFTLPAMKRERLASLYRPGADKAVVKVSDDPVRIGPLTYSAGMPFREPAYLSGGAGLVSTAPDYARFLQMLLNQGDYNGKRLLKRETVELMKSNQIGDLKLLLGGHGDKFGYGFGVVTAVGRGKEVFSPGTFSWGGIYNTFFWVDPEKEVVGILMTQLYPFDHLTIREDFKRLVYESLAKKPPVPFGEANIRISDVALHGDMDCFKIETPTATYVYGKKGAGFAGIIDKDGNDWISYRPGNLAKGEYRGLPKCGQPTKFFHCGYGYGQYKTDNPFTSRVTVRTADNVRIESETRDGKSACTWDFCPTHATMTLQRIDRPTYWFLYEGTPAGNLDAGKDFVIRPDGTKTMLDTPWSQVVPWVCFGSAKSKIGFICINHQEPEEGETDSFVSWPFQKEKDGSFQDMTVFGFGRKGHKELIEHVPDLKRLPARFSIGFVEAADYKTAKAACEVIRNRSK
jgi:uncharacterized repeat protein (TIGR03806 family)